MILASFSSFISQIWKYLLLQLLGLVAAETIGEGEADDSAKVHFVDDVLTSVGVVQMVVACLEDVVAVGFQLKLVVLERLPGEGCVEIA